MRGERRAGGNEPGASAQLVSARRSGQKLLSERGSLDELADAGLSDELTVLDEHGAT